MSILIPPLNASGTTSWKTRRSPILRPAPVSFLINGFKLRLLIKANTSKIANLGELVLEKGGVGLELRADVLEVGLVFGQARLLLVVLGQLVGVKVGELFAHALAQGTRKGRETQALVCKELVLLGNIYPVAGKLRKKRVVFISRYSLALLI